LTSVQSRVPYAVHFLLEKAWISSPSWEIKVVIFDINMIPASLDWGCSSWRKVVWQSFFHIFSYIIRRSKRQTRNIDRLHIIVKAQGGWLWRRSLPEKQSLVLNREETFQLIYARNSGRLLFLTQLSLSILLPNHQFLCLKTLSLLSSLLCLGSRCFNDQGISNDVEQAQVSKVLTG
jgi:hypothetical protein